MLEGSAAEAVACKSAAVLYKHLHRRVGSHLGPKGDPIASKDAIFTDSDFSQNLIAGAPVHYISENIKNTSLFHPPGLQMQFGAPRGRAPPEPPTLQAGPLKSSKT